MLDSVTMHYFVAKAAEVVVHLDHRIRAVLGLAVALPSTVFAILDGERVTLFFAIAGGWLAFLWACRMYPVKQQVDDANKVQEEFHRLREENTKYAEENERLRIRQANIEESGIRKKPEKLD